MKQNIKKFIQKSGATSFAWALIFVLAAGSAAVKAWTEPTATPPGGNLGAPINTGNDLQTKGGPLLINSNKPFPVGLIVDGNVNIGSQESPQAALDVKGKIFVKSDGVNSGELKTGYVSGVGAGYYAVYAP